MAKDLEKDVAQEIVQNPGFLVFQVIQVINQEGSSYLRGYKEKY